MVKKKPAETVCGHARCLGLVERVDEEITALWGQSHRFVGPVVLLKDFLCTILPTICKHHYHLIAVGPRGTALLRNMNREESKKTREGEMQVLLHARIKREGDHTAVRYLRRDMIQLLSQCKVNDVGRFTKCMSCFSRTNS